MTDIPRALNCFVLNNFNLETKKIVLQKGVIDVTKESVKKILGFPLGRKQFSKLPFKTKEDKCYEEWTNQFEDKKMIQLQDIKMKIVSANKEDTNFRMNFIALLINSLIESTSSGKANTNTLNYILLYLDRIKADVLKVERTFLVICHWTSEKIKMTETFEKDELGDFGIGNFNDELYEEVVMINFDAVFKENNEDNQEKNGNADVQDNNSDDVEDDNGDDNDETKKKNGGGILKEEHQGKNKDNGGEDIEIAGKNKDGGEDETDNNDQGLDDMNLHNEVDENEKGGNNEEEQNDGGGGLESKNIEGKNANKAEGRTGEDTQIVEEGVEGKNLEGINSDKGKEITGEEPQIIREGMEGNNIEGNNDKKREGITGEQPQRVEEGVDVKNIEGMNDKKGK
ncbi:uncharacterized protein LOC111899599 [Lactuca sativa]|uniref:uncharacterized protein LOC111899599 n=1 Tax=Lactuca sativa TaxID=4236 RepID=UPI000CD83E77|nr:uncharacterized protein LOC111899599 [Lactuca sativa]